MIISAKIKTNAKEEKIEKTKQDCFLIWVKAKPIEGKANQAAIKILANYFDVDRAMISILKGKTSRQKTFKILT